MPPTAARAAAQLGRLGVVRDLTVAGSTGPDVRRATARPRCPRCCGCSMRRHLPVRSLQLSQPSLDDVFLRQTGRSLRDAGEPRRSGIGAAA